MGHQYAPCVEPGGRIVSRRWPDDPQHRDLVAVPRDDVVLEQVESPGVFTQVAGPFDRYRRTVEREGGELVETTRFDVTIPWFGWLFRWPVRGVLARKYPYRSWWAPPDRLDQTQVLVLGLLAAASMSAAFVNTLFT